MLTIYNQLIEGENIVYKQVYQRAGVQHAKSIGGIFSMRLNYSSYHFGNPFTSYQHLADRDNLVLVQNTKKAVINYIDWVLNSEDTRVIWIRDVLESGILKGKPIVYYRRLGEPSHADALNYLINHYY